MSHQNAELTAIITKFARCGWDAIDAPAKAWLSLQDGSTKEALIAAIEKAGTECGHCGCEFDPLYKRALTLLL